METTFKIDVFNVRPSKPGSGCSADGFLTVVDPGFGEYVQLNIQGIRPQYVNRKNLSAVLSVIDR